MQHSQEYNKLRWQNMLSTMGIKQRLSTTAKSSMSVLRRARLVLENQRLSKSRKFTESGEIVVTSFPSLEQGRPLLVGDTLDTQVQSYVCATRSTG